MQLCSLSYRYQLTQLRKLSPVTHYKRPHVGFKLLTWLCSASEDWNTLTAALKIKKEHWAGLPKDKPLKIQYWCKEQ